MITPGRPVIVIANNRIISTSPLSAGEIGARSAGLPGQRREGTQARFDVLARLAVRGGHLADRLAHSVARPLEVVNP
jgi:hypothetical protein